MNLYTHQESNIGKTWTLMTIFLAIVVGIGWFFSWMYADPVILYAVAFFAVVQVIVSYWYSDKMVLSMTGAKEISRESHRELWNVVENLCITAGLPVPKIYIITDPAPNAFATGRNKNHAVVAVTTGLLGRLNRIELEGVIAHELSHIGNRDILISSVAVILVGFISMLSHVFIRGSLFGGERRDNRSGGKGQLIIIILGLVLIILSPILASLMRLAISRQREYLADATGALITRYPEGLASALEKISAYKGTLRDANPATAHLFISNPLKEEGLGKKWAALWSTHPPMKERVKRLRESNSMQ